MNGQYGSSKRLPKPDDKEAYQDPFSKLIQSYKTHGVTFLLDLGRHFRNLDGKNENRISREDFMATMRNEDLLSEAEAEEILADLDINDTGYVILDYFLKKLRPPMSRIRRQTIEATISKVDIDNDGLIPLAHLEELWDGTAQSYLGEEKSIQERKEIYLDILRKNATHKNYVTEEELTNLHWIHSAMTEEDADFVLTMRQAYRLDLPSFRMVAGKEYSSEDKGPQGGIAVEEDDDFVPRQSRTRSMSIALRKDSK